MKVCMAVLTLVIVPLIVSAQQITSPIILSLVNDTMRVDIYPGDRVVIYDMKRSIVARGNPIGFLDGKLEVIGRRSNIVSLEEISRIDHIKHGFIGQPLTSGRKMFVGSLLSIWAWTILVTETNRGSYERKRDFVDGLIVFSVFTGPGFYFQWRNVSAYKITEGGWSLLYE